MPTLSGTYVYTYHRTTPEQYALAEIMQADEPVLHDESFSTFSVAASVATVASLPDRFFFILRGALSR